MGLPGSFPNFDPILQYRKLETGAPRNDDTEDMDRLHFASPHLNALRDIVLPPGFPVAVVSFDRGQGVTTVARFIHKILTRGNVERRIHPVLVSVDDLTASGNGALMDALERVVRSQVAQSFADNRWSWNMGAQEYAKLWGVHLKPPSGTTLFGTTIPAGEDDAYRKEAVGHYHIQRLLVQRKLEQAPPEPLVDNESGVKAEEEKEELKSPFLGPMDELMRVLSDHTRTRIHFVVDASSTSHDDAALTELQEAIQLFMERYGSNNFNVIYLGDREGLTKVQPKSGTRRTTNFPRYTSADIFAMLSRRYKPRDGSLATVVDPSLIKSVGPINQALQEFDQNLLDRLAQSEDIPYKIG